MVEVYTEFGADGRQAGCSSVHGAVCIWDEELVAKETFLTKEKGLRLVRWNQFPDVLGRDALAILSVSGHAALWIRGEDEKFKQLKVFNEGRGQVLDLAFGPSFLGTILGTASADGSIRIYEHTDFSLSATLSCAHGTACSALAWDLTTGRPGLVASAGRNQLKVYRRDGNVEWFLEEIRHLAEAQDTILHVAWSPRDAESPIFAAITATQLFLSFDAQNSMLLFENTSSVTSGTERDTSFRRIAFNDTGSLLSLIDSARVSRLFKRDFFGNWNLLRTYDPPPILPDAIMASS